MSFLENLWFHSQASCRAAEFEEKFRQERSNARHMGFQYQQCHEHLGAAAGILKRLRAYLAESNSMQAAYWIREIDDTLARFRG